MSKAPSTSSKSDDSKPEAPAAGTPKLQQHKTLPAIVTMHKTGTITSGANFPMDSEGRVYHLGIKKGEVANRILSVGDPKRAERLSALLDQEGLFMRASNRGFVIYTGKFKGGLPMMDFLVRETRAVVDGPVSDMAIVRFGTCGTVKAEIPIGSICVNTPGSICVHRNADGFRRSASAQEKADRYHVYQPVPANRTLSELVAQQARGAWPNVFEGLNASADSFYSSQGRTDESFPDDNVTLIDDLVSKYPELTTLEMETFQLLDLAEVCAKPIAAAAAVIVLANRRTNEFLSNEMIAKAESTVGPAVLTALSLFPIAP